MAAVLERPMAEPKGQKTTPVRITDEAIKWARIASGYTGESMAEYVSRIIVERGREDAKELHAEATGEPRPSEGTTVPKSSRKGTK